MFNFNFKYLIFKIIILICSSFLKRYFKLDYEKYVKNNHNFKGEFAFNFSQIFTVTTNFEIN
jgi:hypothetical protein